MDFFRYDETTRELYGEKVRMSDVADQIGTPAYVYSRATIEHHYDRLAEAFAWAKPLICYSIKACSNLAVLKLLAERGSGFDVVSAGEIHRALKVGADPRKIVFAGVGKTDAEMDYALNAGILMFTVESEPEIEALNATAAKHKTKAQVALRVNPDVDPKTHTYVSTGKRESKFGVDLERASRMLAKRAEFPHVEFSGVHVHIGSQITTIEPYVEALTRVRRFVEGQERAGVFLENIDIGGGFGIFYKGKEAKSADEFAAAVKPILAPLKRKILMEPGRFIVGNAGILLARVTFVKESGDKRFVVVDAAMNDLLRPSLYHAEHRIWPVKPSQLPEEAAASTLPRADIVGPVCESGDFLALDRPFPHVKRGELLAVFSAGAYGMTMSSNYNSRPRAPEVLVEGDRFRVVRKRETLDDLTRLESC